MKLTEAKQQFISSWGAFGTHWGINRTMAQIHALLLVSPDPLTQDDIMEELNISRGNTNMNIRELINVLEYAFVVCKEKWIRREHLPGYLIHERPRKHYGERQKAEGPRGPGELEKILLALEQAQGKKAEAARRLGLSRVTLWKKMKKYNLVA